MKHLSRHATLLIGLVFAAAHLTGQITAADYQRASELRTRFQGLALNIPGPVTWIEGTNLLWYRKSVQGGNKFVLVDADAATKKPAFDHEKLAASLSAAAGEKYTAITLPFADITFV